jgi:hypothetical protein
VIVELALIWQIPLVLVWLVCMKRSKDFKFHFDVDQGVYVKDSEISVNWLLSEVLKQENLQITKVSTQELDAFLLLLKNSNLRMPNGQHSLFWLMKKVEEYEAMAKSKLGENWLDTAERFKFIRHQISVILSGTNIEEYDTEMKPGLEKINRTPNNLEARFEPL